jgi:hypothetical protein
MHYASIVGLRRRPPPQASTLDHPHWPPYLPGEAGERWSPAADHCMTSSEERSSPTTANGGSKASSATGGQGTSNQTIAEGRTSERVRIAAQNYRRRRCQGQDGPVRLGDGRLPPSGPSCPLRSSTFGHVRQLDQMAGEVLARAWAAGARPSDAPLTVDVDSTSISSHARQSRRVRRG